MPGDMVTIPGGAMLPRALAEQLGLVGPPDGSMLAPVNYGDAGPAATGGIQPSQGSPDDLAAALSATLGDTANALAPEGVPAPTGFSADLGGVPGQAPAPFDPQAALARGAVLGASERDINAAEAAAPPVKAGSYSTAEEIAAGAGSMRAEPVDPVDPAAPPAPAQDQGGITTADLSQASHADAVNLQRQALEEQIVAAKERGDIESAAALEKQRVINESNIAKGTVQAAAEAAAAKDAMRLAKTEREFTAATKAFADKKIDRTRLFGEMGTGRKILLAISAAMSGIGAVLKHEGDKPIPVVEYIDQALREDVDLQFKEKDDLANAAQMKRGEIDVNIQTAGQRQARYALAMAGYTEKAAREFDAIAAGAEVELAAVRAREVGGVLHEKAAGYVAEGVRYQHAEDQQAAELAEQKRARQAAAAAAAASRREDARQFDLNYAQDERKMAYDYDAKRGAEQAALDAATSKMTDERRKDISTRGIGMHLKEDGSIDPDKIYLAATVPKADDIREMFGYAKVADELIADIVRLRDANKGMDKDKFDQLKTATWRKIQSKAAFLIPTTGKGFGMGALDKGLVDVVNKMMAVQDPNSMDLLTGDASEGFLAFRENMISVVNQRAEAARDVLSEGAYQPWAPTLNAREPGGTDRANDDDGGSKKMAATIRSARGIRTDPEPEPEPAPEVVKEPAPEGKSGYDYKPGSEDLAIERRANAGDKAAGDLLIDIAARGGLRGLWAEKTLQVALTNRIR